MPMNQTQLSKITAWVGDKCSLLGTPRDCPACGRPTKREVHNEIVVALVFDGAMQMNRGFGFIVVTCADCGASQLFSAQKLGVV